MSSGKGGIVLGPGEGETVSSSGVQITFKAVSADTRGGYGLWEDVVAGEGPPPHIHRDEEEAFYVLEGEMGVRVGDRVVRAAKGAFVLIPRGVVHTFWNVGPTPAKQLVIVSPAGFEGFLQETDGASISDVDRYTAAAQKYNVEIVEPPPEGH